MTEVNEIKLIKIAQENGYDDAESMNDGDLVIISRDGGDEGFALVKTRKGWIAGNKHPHEGFYIVDRKDGVVVYIRDVEDINKLCSDTEAFAFFKKPSDALLDIIDYGIEPTCL